MALPLLSLSRTFALLSLLMIGLITAGQVFVQWTLLREDLLEWERTVSADAIRREAYARLSPEDFERWQAPETQERFERVFRRPLLQMEILRIKVYDRDMRVVWSDEARLLGARFPDNRHLAEALGGRVVAHLERVAKPENLYERHFAETVEMYVPLAFTAATPGTAAVAGVVEVYKNPSPALANIWRDRWTIVLTSVAGAVLLYGVLFGIVHRASRQLEAQRRDLERQTAALTAANQELRATQDQLRAAERLAAIGEVSAAVAHGIRNPLANIRAAAQVAREAPADSAALARYLGAITAEVDRLGRWLQSLLDATRPFELRPAPTDLNALVEDLLELLGERIARAEVKVERAFQPDLPRLQADAVQLEQALMSVLENALDALPRGGVLAIETRRVDRPEPSRVRVTVRDTGPGIPPEALPRVFEPFYTTKARGTGLGLAIARKVVEGHGGAVALESAPGAGTTVTVTLPAARPAP